MDPIDFLIEDGGDGWWHCPSPLRAAIIDGPEAKFEQPEDERFPETFWLVRVEPAIEWRGDASYAKRWGTDHPLCRPIAPTSLALVMASSPWSGPVRGTPAGVPVYPVVNQARSVAEAELVSGLGIKAGLRESADH